MFSKSIFALLGAFSLVSANLDKPPLHPNLDYLNQGLLDNLHAPSYRMDEWGAGWIPQDCKTMTLHANLYPQDVKTYNVYYADCSAQWIICRHKNSPASLDTMIDMFGKLPVRTRQFVRHIISLPDPAGAHAYNSGGNIAMFNIVNSVNVYVHEAGHSLDLLGAYADKPLSSSAKWLTEYAQDSDVPDPYASTNQIENVAQNTVVATFDVNVPGAFGSVEPHYIKIFHQFATVITEARNAGNLITKGGQCTGRLANSAPVSQSGPARMLTREQRRNMPNVNHDLPVIQSRDFHTGNCSFH